MTPAYDRVVRGALALPGGALADGEIGIADGRVAALAEPGRLVGHELVDARGLLVLPGVVDVHVHTGSEPSEGIRAATRAAAAGGVTTIVDMPFDAAGPLTGVERFERKAAEVDRSALVDIALYGTVPAGGDLGGIEALVAAGVAALKLSTYETDPVRFPRSDDHTMLVAMEAAHAAGVLVALHCENDEIVVQSTAAIAARGEGHDPASHGAARPPVAENEAIAGVVELAAATGAAVHLCHVTTARGVVLAGRARSDGIDVTAETCAHYLLLDEDEMRRQGGRAKVNPPLRSRAEVDALWSALAAGRIDIVSSDHVGWPTSRKDVEPISAAAGFPCVELTLPLLFSAGVVRRGLPLAVLLGALAEAPARRFGLWPAKGAIAIGADADLAILDPNAHWRVDDAALTAAAGWSPYDGLETTGRVTTVLVRGEPVLLGGEPAGRPGHGRLLRPSARDARPVVG